MTTKIIMANESAMGVVTFSWTSPSTGIRARVMWGPGMKPMVCWTAPGRDPRLPGKSLTLPGSGSLTRPR